MKYTDTTMKLRLLNKSLVKKVCDLTNSMEVITYRDGDGKELHWDVVFDTIYSADVRKWIRTQK